MEELAFTHFPKSTVERDANLPTATNVTAAAGDITGAIWTITGPYQVTRIGVQIGTAVVYGAAPTLAVIAVDRRVTNGSETGRVELGRVTIPESAPAGAVYYVDIPTSGTGQTGDLNTGEQLLGEVITQGAGGTGTGNFRTMVWGNPRSEIDRNNTNPAGNQMSNRDTTTVQV